MTIQDTLHNYIVNERFAGQLPPGFNDDYDLIESGSIDSLFMVGFITYLERQFGIEFGINDIVPKHFRSVSAMSAFVGNRAK